MSKQLNEINSALEHMLDSLRIGNRNISDTLKKLEVAVNRHEGKGIKGTFYKMFDKIKTVFGNDSTQREEAKEHLRDMAAMVAKRSQKTQKLLQHLMLLADKLDKKETPKKFIDHG